MCLKLFKLFAAGLHIPETEGGQTYFSARHDRSKGLAGNTLRFLHYPAIPEDAE